jgi:hypothetical protein
LASIADLLDFVVVPILAAGVGAAIYALVAQGVLSIRSRRGEMGGDWWQRIPPQSGEPAKLDWVHCSHGGENLDGFVHRILPIEQQEKEWNFRGKKKESFVFTTFWTRSEKVNPESYGTIQLTRSSRTSFDGFYMKSIPKKTGAVTVVPLDRFEMTWNRMSPEESRVVSKGIRGTTLDRILRRKLPKFQPQISPD